MPEHPYAAQPRSRRRRRRGAGSRLQYVRKVSGCSRPSRANQEAFDRAVDEVAHVTMHLLDALVTAVPPKDREVEAAKRRERSQRRYASAAAGALPPV